MTHLSPLTRSMRIILALAVFQTLLPSGFAQQADDDQEPLEVQLYKPTDLDLRIPKGVKATPGNGVKLLVRSPLGNKQVAQLLCRFDDQLIVIRPTGDLAQLPKSETQPATTESTKYTLEDVKHLLKESGLEDYKMKWEKPYLFVYDCSDDFYEYTNTVIRSMYVGVVKQLQEWELDIRRPQVPLLVVITPSREAFDELSQMPPAVLAYYDPVSNQIVLYEDQKLADAAPEYAFKRAAYTIVHEAVHQLLANTGVEKRLSSWPRWVSEGVPEYLSPLHVRSKIVRKGAAELPERRVRYTKAGIVNDIRMRSLLRMKGQDGALVKHVVTSDDLDGDGYAVAWGLVHHLAKNRRTEFQAYLKDVSALAPLGDYGADATVKHQQMFVDHFGDDFADIERGVQAHLTSKKVQAEYVDPIANQTQYLVKMIKKKGRQVLNSAIITTSPAAAREWKEEQEREFPNARFYTIICESEREAKYQWTKLFGR